jgi:mannan endo-1,4-beta-mannosidase
MMLQRCKLSIVSVLVLLAVGAGRIRLDLPVSSAILVGTTQATTQTSAGPVQYVSGFKNQDQWVAFPVDTPGGMYHAAVRYRSDGDKGFNLTVNDAVYTNTFPSARDFTTCDAGLVELPAGQTQIRIGGGWGYYDIAGLTLTPADPLPPPHRPSPRLVTANASTEARALFRTLVADYGRFTFAGVHEFSDLDYVREKTGRSVAMIGGDLIEYTPSRVEHGASGGQMTENLIAQARQGRVITLCWHWNAPSGLIDKITREPDGSENNQSWYFGFYTRATTFDFAKALDDENGADYRLILRDIDAIAVQLRKLQAAHVPVIWRPLHEAEGGWFWWGSKGPQNYVRLYRLLYNRLTRFHHLDNLIWVYTSAGSPQWYPGDDVVDIVAADAYPQDNRDPLTGIWNTLLKQFGTHKLLALAEVGCIPDVDRMRRHGVYWSFYNTWNGKNGPRGMTDEELRARLISDAVPQTLILTR